MSKNKSEWTHRKELDDFLERAKAPSLSTAEAELEAKVEYTTLAIREIIKNRRHGGSISFEKGEVRVQLSDLSPEVVSVREAVKRGWL
jgi:hypothetical protein